jgi:phospholipase D1/2
MEDYNMIDTTMDGAPYKAGHHAATLRRFLWREHLGLLPSQSMDGADDPNAQPPDVCPNDALLSDEHDKFVSDPLSDELWHTWCSQADKNTETFRFLFRADPDENIESFAKYEEFCPRNSIKQGHLHDPYMPVEEVKRWLDGVKGHLVWMPLGFLREAEMAEKGTLTINQYTESIYT